MATPKKPIVTPKQGNVPTGSWVRRDSSTGRFMDVKELVDIRGGVAKKYVVAKVTGVASGNRAEMLKSIKRGLSFGAIAQLETELQASQKELSYVLSIPQSTLTRRKKEGLLHPDESDRVVRLAHLKDAALALMHGDENAAIAWLRTPLDIFGGETPLEYSSTELGARDVEDLIGRLRHGVFS